MVKVETSLGYGFHVSRDQAASAGEIADDYLFKPMCSTCGQSPYFFGLELQKTFGRKPPFEPTFMMFTNISVG